VVILYPLAVTALTNRVMLLPSQPTRVLVPLITVALFTEPLLPLTDHRLTVPLHLLMAPLLHPPTVHQLTGSLQQLLLTAQHRLMVSLLLPLTHSSFKLFRTNLRRHPGLWKRAFVQRIGLRDSSSFMVDRLTALEATLVAVMALHRLLTLRTQISYSRRMIMCV
jgi:hypothetical protein